LFTKKIKKKVVKSEERHCPSPKSTSLPKQNTRKVGKSEDQHCPSLKSTCLPKRQKRTEEKTTKNFIYLSDN
jgi:hypothetical protein